MQYKVKIMKKALGKFLLILLAMSFISSFIPATAFAKSGEDADLKSIEVSCGVLDPEFDGSKTKYTLYIPSDLTQIVITPTPKSENAKANKINLTLGTKQEPEITVSCTCADDKKEYTIQIKRIDKTTSEIEKEISQNGYAVYVTNQKFYQVSGSLSENRFSCMCMCCFNRCFDNNFAVSFYKKEAYQSL